MTTTPEQARELIDGAVPGPWDASFDDESDATRLYQWGEDEEIEDSESWELARNAPDLAQTIAGMRWEYGVEHLGHVSRWGSRESAEDDFSYYFRTGSFIPRLVRRLVGPVEVVE